MTSGILDESTLVEFRGYVHDLYSRYGEPSKVRDPVTGAINPGLSRGY